MLLQTALSNADMEPYFDLIEEYKTKGIVKKYDYNADSFENFEWVQEKVNDNYLSC